MWDLNANGFYGMFDFVHIVQPLDIIDRMSATAAKKRSMTGGREEAAKKFDPSCYAFVNFINEGAVKEFLRLVHRGEVFARSFARVRTAHKQGFITQAKAWTGKWSVRKVSTISSALPTTGEAPALEEKPSPSSDEDSSSRGRDEDVEVDQGKGAETTLSSGSSWNEMVRAVWGPDDGGVSKMPEALRLVVEWGKNNARIRRIRNPRFFPIILKRVPRKVLPDPSMDSYLPPFDVHAFRVSPFFPQALLFLSFDLDADFLEYMKISPQSGLPHHGTSSLAGGAKIPVLRAANFPPYQTQKSVADQLRASDHIFASCTTTAGIHSEQVDSDDEDQEDEDEEDWSSPWWGNPPWERQKQSAESSMKPQKVKGRGAEDRARWNKEQRAFEDSSLDELLNRVMTIHHELAEEDFRALLYLQNLLPPAEEDNFDMLKTNNSKMEDELDPTRPGCRGTGASTSPEVDGGTTSTIRSCLRPRQVSEGTLAYSMLNSIFTLNPAFRSVVLRAANADDVGNERSSVSPKFSLYDIHPRRRRAVISQWVQAWQYRRTKPDASYFSYLQLPTLQHSGAGQTDYILPFLPALQQDRSFDVSMNTFAAELLAQLMDTNPDGYSTMRLREHHRAGAPHLRNPPRTLRESLKRARFRTTAADIRRYFSQADTALMKLLLAAASSSTTRTSTFTQSSSGSGARRGYHREDPAGAVDPLQLRPIASRAAKSSRNSRGGRAQAEAEANLAQVLDLKGVLEDQRTPHAVLEQQGRRGGVFYGSYDAHGAPDVAVPTASSPTASSPTASSPPTAVCSGTSTAGAAQPQGTAYSPGVCSGTSPAGALPSMTSEQSQQSQTVPQGMGLKNTFLFRLPLEDDEMETDDDFFASVRVAAQRKDRNRHKSCPPPRPHGPWQEEDDAMEACSVEGSGAGS
ncbi:unnamed protein product [Amoebophrya sp. A25]|nr:unnamed protein product [Amoebophrya sp. A25]|eukprot:GSA25T00010227001.1